MALTRRTLLQGAGASLGLAGLGMRPAFAADALTLGAMQVRTLIGRDFSEAFGKVDAIVTPTSPTTAFKIGERADDPLQMYLSDIFTVPVNLAGLPGMSVPCGFDSDGLPIGMHIIAPALKEETIFQVAGAYEEATEWHKRTPDL